MSPKPPVVLEILRTSSLSSLLSSSSSGGVRDRFFPGYWKSYATKQRFGFFDFCLIKFFLIKTRRTLSRQPLFSFIMDDDDDDDDDDDAPSCSSPERCLWVF